MNEFYYIIFHYLAISLISLISYLFGRRLLISYKFSSLWESIGFSTALGLGVIAYLVFFAGLLGLLNKLVIMTLLLIGLLCCYNVWINWPSRLVDFVKQVKRMNKSRLMVITGAFILLLAISLPTLVMPLYPPTAFDATMYHLALAKYYNANQKIIFSPDIRFFTAWPQINEMLFTLMLLFYDDVSAQMVQFLMMILVAISLFAWGRRMFSKQTGSWAAAIWLSNPMVLWLGGSGYIDMGFALFVTLGVYSFFNWLEIKEEKWLVIIGVFCGLASGSKLTGLFTLGLLGILIFFRSLKSRKFPGNMLSPLLFIAVSFLVAAPWYIRSYILTGNPIFPFLSNIFGYTLYNATELKGLFNDVMQAHGAGKSFLSFVLLPWNLAVNQGVFIREAPISPLCALLMPVFIVWELIVRRMRYIAIFGMGYIIFWFFSSQILRYFVPLLPIISLGIAALFDCSLHRIRYLRRWVSGALVTAIILGGLIAPGYAYTTYKIEKEGIPPVTQFQKESYLAKHIIGYDAVNFLNNVKGNQYTLYSLFDENCAYFANGKFKGDWFGPSNYYKVVNYDGGVWKLKNGDELYKELRSMGVDYLLVTTHRHQVQLPEDDFFQKHFKLVYTGQNCLLYELSEKPIILNLSAELLKNPSFEMLDEKSFPKYWSVYNQPVIDASGMHSKTGKVGIYIDTSSMVSSLSQQVPVLPGGVYLLSYYARSDQPLQNARLQVNWHDKEERFLKTDINVVGVSREWKKYSMYVSVPEGATFAVIYVQPHQSSSVWFDDYSFAQVQYTSTK